jgi:hypothetical protein
MAIYFADSSALVKRYIREASSAWVDSIVSDTVNDIYVSEIARVEVVATITRRGRGQRLSAARINTTVRRFLADLDAVYLPIAVTHRLIERATELAMKHGLRGYDAMQLAAALLVRDRSVSLGEPIVTLISADHELNAAASAEGLAVQNADDYPGRM